MRLDLDIQGMTCSGCLASVRRLLAGHPGVTTTEVDLETGRAFVEAASDLDVRALILALDDAGFEGRVRPS